MKTKITLLIIAAISLLTSCSKTDPTEFNKKITDKLWVKFEEGYPTYGFYIKSNGTANFYNFMICPKNEEKFNYNGVSFKYDKESYDWKWDASFDRRLIFSNGSYYNYDIYILKVGYSSIIIQESASSDAIKLETNSTIEKKVVD